MCSPFILPLSAILCGKGTKILGTAQHLAKNCKGAYRKNGLGQETEGNQEIGDITPLRPRLPSGAQKIDLRIVIGVLLECFCSGCFSLMLRLCFGYASVMLRLRYGKISIQIRQKKRSERERTGREEGEGGLVEFRLKEAGGTSVDLCNKIWWGL